MQNIKITGGGPRGGGGGGTSSSIRRGRGVTTHDDVLQIQSTVGKALQGFMKHPGLSLSENKSPTDSGGSKMQNDERTVHHHHVYSTSKNHGKILECRKSPDFIMCDKIL